MGQSAAQPFIDARDKVIDWANKLESWDKPAPKKGPPPLAKDLHWADQTGMRKAADDPKLGGAKKATPSAKKRTAAKKRQ